MICSGFLYKSGPETSLLLFLSPVKWLERWRRGTNKKIRIQKDGKEPYTTMSHLRKVQRCKGRKSNLHPSTLLQLEESKLLASTVFIHRTFFSILRKFSFFFSLNTKLLEMGCKVLKDRGKCIINTVVQSLAGTVRKKLLLPPSSSHLINEFLRQIQNTTLHPVKIFWAWMIHKCADRACCAF